MAVSGSDAQPPRYDVMWPLSRKAVKRAAAASRIADLNGRTVCELWDGMFRGEVIFPMLRQQLKAMYPNVKIVEYQNIGTIDVDGPRERAVLEELPDRMHALKCDAVIVGIGA